MTYLYLLAGEKIELAESELKGFLESQSVDEKPDRNGKLCETDAEPGQLKRLALTHEVSQKKTEIPNEDLEDFSPESKPESSFAVRSENLSGEENRKDLEKILGEKFSGEDNTVDLENPETVIKAYILDEKIVIGHLVQDIDRGLFEKRKNQNRPFSSPVSMDPVLARVLVNLSGIKPGKHLLDPFCGTGGILIEAGLCGIGVCGTDMKEEMVEGCRENLEEYGIISHDIRKNNASQALEIFDTEFSAIVTDLPYGKSSKTTESAVEDFLELIENFDSRSVFIYNEQEIGEYSSDFRVYVHKNLTRHIFIV